MFFVFLHLKPLVFPSLWGPSGRNLPKLSLLRLTAQSSIEDFQKVMHGPFGQTIFFLFVFLGVLFVFWVVFRCIFCVFVFLGFSSFFF